MTQWLPRRIDQRLLCARLWLTLAALCQVIPGGVVALFPSYALLDNMYRNWTAAAGIVDRIAKRRPVFVESSTSSGDVLEFYSARIKTARSTGALMLSVVGGRLSEGINFSDKLGRAVVIVGVPFPSLASLELAE
ncbi:DEAD H (Asp-Glu-Ala-Asp His) box helicase 11 [Coemansia sp. RSA 922]|nr:DEAD H (Asp-Glu-Ala-Asp His) box helicase 11 [Coemansia sp. S3946]KAJ2111527.1 DEAD H (Asp-Glu-Ala-Asp His) box helicase 11 [Coemansia sp. RSA 922]KAJ2342764.1 DEAD H (Asp-Glu-Ala-Asp His) box helicase 11 [Coemansia sp. RSA 2673]